jgi:hypothetical protein
MYEKQLGNYSIVEVDMQLKSNQNLLQFVGKPVRLRKLVKG